MKIPPAERIQSCFMDALDLWSERPAEVFPVEHSPAIFLGSKPEDRTLAKAFLAIGTKSSLTEKMICASEIVEQKKRFLSLAQIGDSNADLSPFQTMVQVLVLWFDALQQHATLTAV